VIVMISSARLRRIFLATGLWASVLMAGDGPVDQGATITVPSGGKKEDAGFDLFPINKPWRDVRVPRYDEKDRLTSIMHSEKLTRDKLKELQMEDLTLAMFEDDGSLALRLETKRATYDLTNSELRTQTNALIQHPKFDLQGDSLLFDTRSGKGKLTGHVEMRIFDTAIETMSRTPGSVSAR
jgi:hypothetical protein